MSNQRTQQDIKRKVDSFINLVRANKIPLRSVFLFGSQVNGTLHPGSDIDVCLVSPSFSDRFEDRLKLMGLRRQIDIAIEPHPFHPSDFIDEDPLVWEIKTTGKKIL